MARRLIPYPCEYKMNRGVRRARRAGNIFVLALIAVLVLALGFGTFLAFYNNGAWVGNAKKLAESFTVEAYHRLGRIIPQADAQTAAPDASADATSAPSAEATAKPTAAPTPKPTAKPTAAPTADASATPAPTNEPDTLYKNYFAPTPEAAYAELPDMVEAVSPGVVGVVNYRSHTGYTGTSLVEWGSGTGFVITTNGYIVTNQHVVEDAEKLTVLLEDGTEIDAKLIGADVSTDIAVLKIDRTNLVALPLGNSDAVRVGESVLAIGNPLDSTELFGSVTLGIISAKARNINIDGFTNEYLQTDAAINFGNSGGPLINMKGEVIGMNSAKYVTAGYDEYGNAVPSEGIGFALPINNVMSVVDSLISAGGVQRPGIGVTISTRDAETAAAANTEPGVYVYAVTEGGPADLAGMQVNDIILAIDGTTLASQDDMIAYIHTLSIGDTVRFTVLRGTTKLDVTVTVGDMNAMP